MCDGQGHAVDCGDGCGKISSKRDVVKRTAKAEDKNAATWKAEQEAKVRAEEVIQEEIEKAQTCPARCATRKFAYWIGTAKVGSKPLDPPEVVPVDPVTGTPDQQLNWEATAEISWSFDVYCLCEEATNLCA